MQDTTAPAWRSRLILAAVTGTLSGAARAVISWLLSRVTDHQ
ncbi:hypothetical protein [Dactylosporangium aurantiacum]|nr:hypothetical protein [Dactylosporangium aurantiacum]MDG6109580.1 hypothetical protein [Dactylosporangium aurantiacum]